MCCSKWRLVGVLSHRIGELVGTRVIVIEGLGIILIRKYAVTAKCHKHRENSVMGLDSNQFMVVSLFFFLQKMINSQVRWSRVLRVYCRSVWRGRIKRFLLYWEFGWRLRRDWSTVVNIWAGNGASRRCNSLRFWLAQLWSNSTG